MRGLNVYCCPSCGHYGFFQLSANAVCPHCSISMTTLPISYQTFMDLDYPQRQILISRHMLNAAVASDSSKKSHLHASPPGSKSSCSEKSLSLLMAACTAIQLPNDTPCEESGISAPASLSVSTEKAEEKEVISSSTHSSDVSSDTAATTESPSNDSKTDSSSEPSDKEELYQEIKALREKNEQLEQTVSWMHDLIWDLTRRLHIT